MLVIITIHQIEKTYGILIMDKIEFIAGVRHACWVSYQIAAGQPHNIEMNDDQRASLYDGIRFQLDNPDITSEENHENWMKMKIAQGWKYGTTKDFDEKTHPDLVPFDDLPDIEKLKDVADKVSHGMALELWDIMEDWKP